jgi:hypothetical protein
MRHATSKRRARLEAGNRLASRRSSPLQPLFASAGRGERVDAPSSAPLPSLQHGAHHRGRRRKRLLLCTTPIEATTARSAPHSYLPLAPLPGDCAQAQDPCRSRRRQKLARTLPRSLERSEVWLILQSQDLHGMCGLLLDRRSSLPTVSGIVVAVPSLPPFSMDSGDPIFRSGPSHEVTRDRPSDANQLDS